jgi:hypothetical protein
VTCLADFEAAIRTAYDPDPADEQYETTILYLIRDRGHLRIETDDWTIGFFSLDTWRRVLRETGFEVHERRYHADEGEYTVFACVKPLASTVAPSLSRRESVISGTTTAHPGARRSAACVLGPNSCQSRFSLGQLAGSPRQMTGI